MKTLRLFALLSFFSLAACGDGNSSVAPGEDGGVDSGSITADGGRRDASNDDADVDSDAGEDDASVDDDGGFIDDDASVDEDGGFIDDDADIEPLEDASVGIDMTIIIPEDLGVIVVDASTDLGVIAVDAGRDLGVIVVDAGRDLGVVEVDAGRDLGVVEVDAGRDLGVIEVDAGRDLGVIGRDAETLADASTTGDAGSSATICNDGIWIDSVDDLTTYEPCVTTTDVYVDPDFSGTSVYLPNLEIVTGDVLIDGVLSVEEIDLPALRDVEGDMTLGELLATDIELPNFLYLGGSLTLDQLIGVETLSFETLGSIRGNLTVTNNSSLVRLSLRGVEEIGWGGDEDGAVQISQNSSLESVDFTSLLSLRGYLTTNNNESLTSLSFDATTIMGGISIFENQLLRSLSLLKLAEITDQFYLQSNDVLRSVFAPMLTTVSGGISAFDNDLCEFPPSSQMPETSYSVSFSTRCP